jgi:hypothetical protein
VCSSRRRPGDCFPHQCSLRALSFGAFDPRNGGIARKGTSRELLFVRRTRSSQSPRRNQARSRRAASKVLIRNSSSPTGLAVGCRPQFSDFRAPTGHCGPKGVLQVFTYQR